ncbi:DUF5658 family protein [Natrinema pallidum]|uniref:DUF5658 domain-containing protein n=1 Tax=Natrinema pallidum DSM 3751 TaxID=1227495 RepID=L9YGH4_9EURY|nr:DUF5658 family protein [Natrinema pallidum]ELY73225.1 hypothetical protein C487_17525 [Natrinema pallidum DSM 3751]
MSTRTVTIEIPIPRLTPESACWLLVAAAIAVDLITTQIGLQAGLIESNPVARDALEYGVAGALALKAGAIGVGVACRPLLAHPYRPLIPLGLALPWLAAGAWNWVAITGVLA